MGKKINPNFVIVFSIFILCASGPLSSYGADMRDPDSELYSQVELFSDAITVIQSEYVNEVEPKKLIYGALEGMLSSLDGYSQFMDPESYKEMEIETKGEFGGVGIEIAIKDGILTVIAPIDGTPAHAAGLKSGDKIIAIDEEDTRDMKLTEAVKKLRGEPKTKVKLGILREKEEKLLEFTIERNIIKIKSVKTAKIIQGDIGYIRLVEFQQNTSRELEEKLKELSGSGMKSLILDLRNNPGGLLDAAYDVSNTFLEKGKVVVSLKGRIPSQNKTFQARGRVKFVDFPMAVLVNEGSASASEIVAGAIQDNKRGTVVGAKTFGKGSVQTVIPLKDGSAVRLTTAAYYTPNGNNINEKGITPDIEVKLEEVKETAAGGVDELEARDNQLQAAINALKNLQPDFAVTPRSKG